MLLSRKSLRFLGPWGKLQLVKESVFREGSWALKSQPEIANRLRLSIAPLKRNAVFLALVSEIAAFFGSAMGTAIAKRCDFGALSSLETPRCLVAV